MLIILGRFLMTSFVGRSVRPRTRLRPSNSILKICMRSMVETLEREIPFVVHLRDCAEGMVAAWREGEAFGDPRFQGRVEVSCGDIFEGGPSADAIVSPANSFGFMNGGIDMAYSMHFGWQMQDRLQKHLREDYDGELPVGNAVVIPAYASGMVLSKLQLSPTVNQGQPIRYLISAPTMRVPSNVAKTTNAYLAFRAVLRAVKQHNQAHADDIIHTVLCPGLGTAVGRMPYKRCAVQMRMAYEAIMFGDVEAINCPPSLHNCCSCHTHLITVGEESGTRFSAKPQQGELFVP